MMNWTSVEAHNVASGDLLLIDGIRRKVIRVDRLRRRVSITIAAVVFGRDDDELTVPAGRSFAHVGYDFS
jgi:hypothetical protein